MTYWLTSPDGEISFFCSADNAESACAQLAAKYGKASFAEFCLAADYDPGSFRVAGVEVQPRHRDESNVGFIAAKPPPGLLQSAWLRMRQR